MAHMSNLKLIHSAYKVARGKKLSPNEEFYMELYATELANIISRGRLVPLSNLGYDEVQLAYNFLGTSNTRRKIYCITKFDANFEGNLSQDIKESIQAEYPQIEVITQLTERPFKYRTDTKQFLSQHSNAIRQYNTISAMFDKLPEDVKERGLRVGSKVINRHFVDNLHLTYRSFQYITQMIKYNKLSLTYCFIHVIMPEFIMDGDKEVNPEDAVERIMNEYAHKNSIVIKEVRDIDDYLTDLSPIGFQRMKGQFTNMNANLFAPPNFSAHIDLTQGIEGEAGIDYGILLSNNTPFLLDLKSSPNAQVILTTGQAGSGKSNLIKGALEAHMIQKDFMDICDIKGVDYTGLKDLYPQQTAVLDLYKGVYPNLLDMSDLPNPDENTRDDLLEYTIDIMIALLELSPKEIDSHYNDCVSLLRILLIHYVESMGVTTDPKTFHLSSGMNYFKFWEYASQELAMSPSIKEDYQDVVPLLTKRLSQYLSYEGKRKSYFKTQLNPSEILKKQAVIYAFHTISKDKKDLRTALSFLYMSALSLIRNQYIKSQKMMQVLVYEELQEASNDIALLKTIAKRATVSRSSNVTMYTVFNNVEMFQPTESSEINKALSSLKACYTTYFIGYMEEGNTQFLKDNFRVKEIHDYIDIINNAETAKENKYNFAVKYNTGDKKGSGMIRQILPNSYTDNSLYKTREVTDEART